MTHCTGDSSGLDHRSSAAALFPGGQRAGQVSQGSEVGKGRAWTEGLRHRRALLKKGLKFLEENPWPGAGQKARWRLQERLRGISWAGIYTAIRLGW